MIYGQIFSRLRKTMKLLGWQMAAFLIIMGSFLGCWKKPISPPSPSPQEVPREDFLTKSRSSVLVEFPSLGRATVYLNASNEKEGTIEYPYCGGGRGSKTYEGQYELILTQDLKVLSRLPLGQLSFVEGYPFDGQLRVETVSLEEEEKSFVTLFQYLSCNTNEVLVFGFDEREGKLLEIPFVRKDGGEVMVLVDPGETELLAESGDRFLTRFYDNSLGWFRVTSWVFDPTKLRFEEESYKEEEG